MSESRRVTLCADDFALDSATSDGILALAAASRISAVSCLTDSPSWPSAGKRLLEYRDNVLVGLHFNLTEPFGVGHYSLGYLIAAAIGRRIDRAAVKAHFDRQLHRFVSVTGFPPDFIDGHQHVHAFPVIGSIVARAAAEANPAAPIPIRSVRRFFGPTDAACKRAVIRTLAKSDKGSGDPNHRVPMNSAFAGDYSLRVGADYAGLFAGWLHSAPDGALIMCHPGHGGTGSAGSAREQEFAFLGSPRCRDLLDRNAIRFISRDDLSALQGRSRAWGASSFESAE